MVANRLLFFALCLVALIFPQALTSQTHLTIESLARRTHSSPRHFARLFKDAFGATLGEYVETLRLDTARERLGAPGQTLESIALSVGFRSADVFRRAFERRFGVTPGLYASHFRRSE